MRLLPILFSISFALLICNNVNAQTAQSVSTTPTAPSKRALRHQDRVDCTKQAIEQKIPKPDQADPIRRCMADRQASRKTSKK